MCIISGSDPSIKCDGSSSSKRETPEGVLRHARGQIANCQGVKVSEPVYVAAPRYHLPDRAYFYAFSQTTEAQACITQAVRNVRSRIDHLRIRSGIDRPNGRRIVIVDYKPERTRKQNRSVGRGGNR